MGRAGLPQTRAAALVSITWKKRGSFTLRYIEEDIHFHKQSTRLLIHKQAQTPSHLTLTREKLFIATMAAIGSLVFCTDCGNLLETNTSRKTFLTCDVCGAQNKGTNSQCLLKPSQNKRTHTLTPLRHLQQDHLHSLKAHRLPLKSAHAPALRRARVRRGRHSDRRHHRPPM